MNYNYDDGLRMPDESTIPSAMLAEIMRCIAHSLLDKAEKLERPSSDEPPPPQYSSKGDDTYNF